MASDTTVSLPAHLRSTLNPISDILPEDLRKRLFSSLEERCNEISHSILLDISKWARNGVVRSQLHARGLEPSDYSIISLLAGTTTSPSSTFPPYVPPLSAAVEGRRATNDKKAITAILNALLSISCVGFAAWWASGHTGWRDEWRALFALMVAMTIAISEVILYLIWQSRKIGSNRRRVLLRAQREQGGEESIVEKRGQDMSNTLRRRQGRVLDK